MIGFYKVNGTDIRRVWECSSTGRKLTVKALIGQVKELHERDIIFHDNVRGNESKWLVITGKSDTDITEFDSLDAAKNFCREKFN